MELKIPGPEELRAAYEEDLKVSFPPRELKPLSHIVDMMERGRYQPWCLYDAGAMVGECFLWLGSPGWALLDYLCVNPGWRNDGFGAWMLSAMRRLAPWKGILVESEAPEDAPDPDLAVRRLGFYTRNGARMAGYDTELFGVHYKTLYWAARPLDDAALLREHQAVYRAEDLPEAVRGYFQIPRGAGPS